MSRCTQVANGSALRVAAPWKMTALENGSARVDSASLFGVSATLLLMIHKNVDALMTSLNAERNKIILTYHNKKIN